LPTVPRRFTVWHLARRYACRRFDFALVDPPWQQAERGELLKGHLLSQDETVIVYGRIPDACEATSTELHAALLTAAPPCGRGSASEAVQALGA
jgi:hypothetical protein